MTDLTPEVLITAAWFATGLMLAPFSFGLTFGHFQRKFPSLAVEYRGDDILLAAIIAFATILIPPVFLVPLVNNGGRGLKFWWQP